MHITIGNDVEFILVKGKVPVSAIGFVGGSKTSPSPCHLGALQEDNVLAEINIYPAQDSSAWETNIQTVVQELKNRLPPFLSLSTAASMLFSEKELRHPLAKEFGCDPDYNAWTHMVNKFTKPTGNLARLRSAGGHVHVGIPKLSVKDGFELIRCMDAFIGTQSVLVDKDIRRKILYGKAGAMRFKPYGVEWRTPSNFWAHTAAGRKWMFDSAMFVALNYKDLHKYYITEDIVTLINSNNKSQASKFLKTLRKSLEFPLHPALEY